jgi:hypothetical protein
MILFETPKFSFYNIHSGILFCDFVKFTVNPDFTFHYIIEEMYKQLQNNLNWILSDRKWNGSVRTLDIYKAIDLNPSRVKKISQIKNTG